MYTIEPSTLQSDETQDFPLQGPSIDRPSFYGSHFNTLKITSTPKKRKCFVDSRMFVTSRQEFLPGEPNGSPVRYKKQGGIFLCKKGIVGLILGIIVLVAFVAGVVFYFTPRYNEIVAASKSSRLEDIGALFESLDKVPRLPKDVIPSFYRLKIKPNFTSLSFDGEVSITVSTTSSNIKQITLHSKNLEIFNNTMLIEQNIITSTPSDTELLLNRIRRNAAPQVLPKNAVIPLENNASNEVSSTTTVANQISVANLSALNMFDTNAPPKMNATTNEQTQKMDDAPILTQVKAENVKITSVEKNSAIDTVSFNLERQMKPNYNYILVIKFKGKIDDSLSGFYRSIYRDAENKTKIAGVTHFQPTSARKAFPCFDEPEYKARFELSIAKNNSLKVLSNMPLTSEETGEENGITWSHFERSLPMSTYLVSFFISDFESTKLPVTSGGTQINIWARKEMLPYTQYAAEITPRIFQFYEDFFKLRYSLPKLDLIAVPDMAVGAMENWGIVMFRETSLLLDPVTGSIKMKKAIAMIIAHELAHQWFGNLVTMKWWNDLWLNEGFATYMEYICINSLEPNWELLEQFSFDRIGVFQLDSLRSTRSVSSTYIKKLTIAQLFDDISYMKAASLLIMLNQVLMKDIYQNGLIKYVKDWQFKNTDQNQLWSAFSSEIGNSSVLPDGVTLKDFMDSWISQAGYPVVNVTRHYENSTATISQNRFYEFQQSEETNQLWHIPITYAVGNVKSDEWPLSPNAWLEKKTRSMVSFPDFTNNTWVYFNIRALGYYRINYDFKNWKLLEYGLFDAPDDFPAVTRGQILDDAFHLARAGYINYTVALDLTKYMIDTEKNVLPWYAVLSNLQLLYVGLQKSDKFGYFQEYVSRLVKPALKTFGYDTQINDTSQDSILRDQLIYWACLIEDQDTLDWAQDYFKNWMNQSDPDKNNPIPRNNRIAVYTTALRMGGKKEFDFLMERYENANDAENQNEIIISLPSTRSTWQLYSLLEYSLTTMDIQMTPALWTGFDSDVSTQTALNFVIDKWDRIFAKYSKVDEQIFPFIINGAFGNIASESELIQFEDFIRKRSKDLKNVSKDIMKNMEKAKSRINWNESKMDDIEKWLMKFSETKTTTVNEYSTLYGKYGALSELSQNFGEFLHTLIDTEKEPTASIFIG